MERFIEVMSKGKSELVNIRHIQAVFTIEEQPGTFIQLGAMPQPWPRRPRIYGIITDDPIENVISKIRTESATPEVALN